MSEFEQRPHKLPTTLLRLLPVVAAVFLLAFLLGSVATYEHAIAQSGTYTVQPGDTLSEIAGRFGVSVEELIAANGIANPNLVASGSQLVIPGVYIAPDPAAIETRSIPAYPGESLAALARRTGQELELLAILNNLDGSQRLFPGRPIAVPVEAARGALWFGAISAIDSPQTLTQGRTGRLVVEASRAVPLLAEWNGMPLPLAPLDAITRQVALLPAGALMEPGSYPVTVGYTTSSGQLVTRDLPLEVVDGGYASQVVSIPADRSELLAPDTVKAELEQVTAAWSVFTTDLMLRDPFARPIGPEFGTTSPFGTRRSYESGEYSLEGFHAGQDFGASPGVQVVAPAIGIVALAEPLNVRGNAVILDHGRGLFTGYWHLSELRVSPGQVVQPGDVIGLVGNTGLSTGAHLHWEARIYGTAVDPLQFLDEAPFP